ncbi:MAG: phage portal protein, partial [Muribaculaceae bacterium]|nr:phage portal protein [Muribaculaceae bacterium]
MQFLETGKFTVRESCRFIGVHPSFVFDDTSNNYKSAEQSSVSFLNYTVNPILCNIEKELLCKLIAPDLAASRKIEFDRRGLYACDISSKMSYMKDCLSIGWTVNELRRLDNLEPIEGGDVPMVSANLKTLNEIISTDKQ